MTPADARDLAREVAEMRSVLAHTRALHHEGDFETLPRYLAQIDARWPAVAGLVREHGEREVCS